MAGLIGNFMGGNNPLGGANLGNLIRNPPCKTFSECAGLVRNYIGGNPPQYDAEGNIIRQTTTVVPEGVVDNLGSNAQNLGSNAVNSLANNPGGTNVVPSLGNQGGANVVPSLGSNAQNLSSNVVPSLGNQGGANVVPRHLGYDGYDGDFTDFYDFTDDGNFHIFSRNIANPNVVPGAGNVVPGVGNIANPQVVPGVVGVSTQGQNLGRVQGQNIGATQGQNLGNTQLINNQNRVMREFIKVQRSTQLTGGQQWVFVDGNTQSNTSGDMIPIVITLPTNVPVGYVVRIKNQTINTRVTVATTTSQINETSSPSPGGARISSITMGSRQFLTFYYRPNSWYIF